MIMTKTVKKKTGVVALGAAINLLLFFIKLYIGLSTNSVAIYADSLNSLTDFAVCTAVIIGFCLSASAKTEDYPFGKGRAEELTELLVSVAILASGGAFAYISFERILYPVPVWYSSAYAVIIAVTAAVKLGLSFFFSKKSRILGSDTINGIAADSRLDFLITVCTLVSFTLSSEAGFSVDGIAGVIISLLLIAEGIKALRAALEKVLGKRNGTICDKAKMIIETDPHVESVEEIRCHTYGENGVFNADIMTDCVTAEDIKNLERRLHKKIKEEFGSEIYFNIGGKDEN